MISDSAYGKLRITAEQGRYSKGVLATALRLYKENYDATQSANNGMSKAQIEALLLMPTNLKSLLDQSEREFRDNARDALFSERTSRSLSEAAWAVFLNIVANIIFIVISVVAYLSMQDTAKNFFKSLGFDVRPSIETKVTDQAERRWATPQKALPAPKSEVKGEKQ